MLPVAGVELACAAACSLLPNDIVKSVLTERLWLAPRRTLAAPEN